MYKCMVCGGNVSQLYFDLRTDTSGHKRCLQRSGTVNRLHSNIDTNKVDIHKATNLKELDTRCNDEN